MKHMKNNYLGKCLIRNKYEKLVLCFTFSPFFLSFLLIFFPIKNYLLFFSSFLFITAFLFLRKLILFEKELSRKKVEYNSIIYASEDHKTVLISSVIIFYIMIFSLS
jgi:hypothetical protein